MSVCTRQFCCCRIRSMHITRGFAVDRSVLLTMLSPLLLPLQCLTSASVPAQLAVYKLLVETEA